MNHAAAVQNLQDWDATLAAKPDVMWDIIGEVLRVVQSQSETDRVGRRLPASSMGFDELWATLFPARFCAEPFPIALRALVGDERQIDFARRVPCTQAQLSYLMTGRREPTATMLDAVAAAGNVTSAYFAEWRARRLADICTEALLADPVASTRITKHILRVMK